MRYCSGLKAQTVVDALQESPLIEAIDFGSCKSMHMSVLTGLAHLKLKKLGLAWLARDDWLTLVGDHFKLLEELDLRYCEQVTTLRHLRPCIQLRSINLEECRRLRDIRVLRFCPHLVTCQLSGTDCVSHEQMVEVLGEETLAAVRAF